MFHVPGPNWPSTFRSSRCIRLTKTVIDATFVRETGICWESPFPAGTFGWLRGVDLNHRPLGYEPNERRLSGSEIKRLNAEGNSKSALKGQFPYAHLTHAGLAKVNDKRLTEAHQSLAPDSRKEQGRPTGVGTKCVRRSKLVRVVRMP